MSTTEKSRYGIAVRHPVYSMLTSTFVFSPTTRAILSDHAASRVLQLPVGFLSMVINLNGWPRHGVYVNRSEIVV